jgi:hypothetical protein
MRPIALIVPLLAAFIGVAPLAAQHGGHGGPPPASSTSRDAAPPPVLFPPQESPGAITLLMAPRWAEGRLTVLVSATTHAGDLATVDLAKAVELRVGGQMIAPTSATALKGHHARATLVFPLADRPERFTLEIRGVPDVEPRTLVWPVAPAPARDGGR